MVRVSMKGATRSASAWNWKPKSLIEMLAFRSLKKEHGTMVVLPYFSREIFMENSCKNKIKHLCIIIIIIINYIIICHKCVFMMYQNDKTVETLVRA